MAIRHPRGRELPPDHPLHPDAPMMVFSIRRLRPPAPKSDQAPAAPEPGGDDEDAGSQADREPS